MTPATPPRRCNAPGELNLNARLTAAVVLDILKWHRDGDRPCYIARRLGVSRECVRDVVRGKTWRHVSGITTLRYHKPPGGRGVRG